MTKPWRVVSIDPGEIHCGVAMWRDGECVWTEESTPIQLFYSLERWIENGEVDVVVCEDFRLYPDKMADQGFSQILTVRVIGALQYIVGRFSNAFQVKAEWIEQPALIKKPTRAQMKARGVANLAVTEGKGGHCADAVLHGYYYLNKP